jgi:1-acyl-sn-glycerol-3-phosphate acyltransferase
MAITVLTVFGFISFLLRLVSLGFLTKFNRKTFVPFYCRLILFFLGIKLENKLQLSLSPIPYFYTFNHNSWLDGFVLMSLGLTKTRFLMSEKMLKFVPAFFSAWSIGVLWVPTKKHKERRLKFFIDLEKRIKKEKISIVGSSEGVHVYNDYAIAEFNRGVYHMALACKMPVISIFIHTPIKSNPSNNFRQFKKGTICLELLDIIPTKNWELKNLDHEIEKNRALYVNRLNHHLQAEVSL